MSISLRMVTIQMEDRLLLKLLQYFGFGDTDSELNQLDESSFESQR